MARPSSFHKVNAEIGHRLTTGIYLPGQRMEADSLAHEMGISASPVRQAFYWRVGEGLLQYNVMGGFNVPVPTERGLKHMFEWQGVLGALALSHGLSSNDSASGWGVLAKAFDVTDTPVGMLDRFFEAAGQLHTNREVHRDYKLITARLAPTQYVRHNGQDPLDETLGIFKDAVNSRDPEGLLSTLSSYYKRTGLMVPTLAEACQQVAATINK